MKQKETWKAAVLAIGGAVALTGCASGGWYGGVDGGATQLTEKQSAIMDKQLAGKVAGEPVSCLSRTSTQDPIRVSDSVLLYRVSKNLVYRNDLNGRCSGLGNDTDIMVVKQFGSSQQCDGDIIHMVDRTSGIPGGSCSFGKFTPYRTASR